MYMYNLFTLQLISQIIVRFTLQPWFQILPTVPSSTTVHKTWPPNLLSHQSVNILTCSLECPINVRGSKMYHVMPEKNHKHLVSFHTIFVLFVTLHLAGLICSEKFVWFERILFIFSIFLTLCINHLAT